MSKAPKSATAMASGAQRGELMAMKKSELRRLAVESGASVESLDAADDLEDSKAALVAVILAVQAALLFRPAGKTVGSLRSSASAFASAPALHSKKTISKRDCELRAQQSGLPNFIPDEDVVMEAPVTKRKLLQRKPAKSGDGGGKTAKDATTAAVGKLQGTAKKKAKAEVEKLSDMYLDSAEEAIDTCFGKAEEALKVFVGEKPESEPERMEAQKEEESESEEEEEELLDEEEGGTEAQEEEESESEEEEDELLDEEDGEEDDQDDDADDEEDEE